MITTLHPPWLIRSWTIFTTVFLFQQVHLTCHVVTCATTKYEYYCEDMDVVACKDSAGLTRCVCDTSGQFSLLTSLQDWRNFTLTVSVSSALSLVLAGVLLSSSHSVVQQQSHISLMDLIHLCWHRTISPIILFYFHSWKCQKYPYKARLRELLEQLQLEGLSVNQ